MKAQLRWIATLALVACPSLAAADPLGLFPKTAGAPPADIKPTLPPKEAAKACLATADEMTKHGHRREAINLYERARQLDPKLKQVCRVLAVLYDLEGNDQKAVAEFTLAIEMFPKDADLMNDLGYFYMSRNDHAAAEKWLRAAIGVSPNHERAWTNLGLSQAAQGRFQDSYDSFAKTLGPAAAHSNVGMLLAKNGRHDDASRAFRNALAINPDLKPAKAGLAVLERQTARR